MPRGGTEPEKRAGSLHGGSALSPDLEQRTMKDSSPTPPASGWNEAVEACAELARDAATETALDGEIYIARKIEQAIRSLTRLDSPSLDDLVAGITPDNLHPETPVSMPDSPGWPDDIARLNMEQVAQRCARGVRGCATDEQYTELIDRISEALVHFAGSRYRSPRPQEREHEP